MVKGFCSVCGKEIGTFFGPKSYQCRGCLKIFCFNCSKKIGLVFKKPACPNCGIELVDDVRKAEIRDERNRSIQTGYGIEEGRKRAIEDTRQREIAEANRRRNIQNVENLIFGKPQYKQSQKEKDRKYMAWVRSHKKKR